MVFFGGCFACWRPCDPSKMAIGLLGLAILIGPQGTLLCSEGRITDGNYLTRLFWSTRGVG